MTQADLASQEAVRRIVLGAFPAHCLLGEEKVPGEPATDRAEYRWIVDPLDGTTNFVHGVPHYSVSLALERNGELLVGAVYDPMLDECFTAAAGRGARLNGRPMHASTVSRLSEALAAVGFPPNVQRDSPDLSLFVEMVCRCQAIRRTGSSALNLCYMAAGPLRCLLVVLDEDLGRGGRGVDVARGRRLHHIPNRRGVLSGGSPFPGGCQPATPCTTFRGRRGVKRTTKTPKAQRGGENHRYLNRRWLPVAIWPALPRRPEPRPFVSLRLCG